MLTIFATPKPFVGMAGIHQANALKSWARIRPKPEVLVFGNEEGLSDIAGRLGFTHIEDVERLDGIPLLNSLFTMAQDQARNELLLYTNSDVIIVDGLMDAASRLLAMKQQFLGVCRRWDIRLDEPLHFSKHWRQKMHNFIQETGELHGECSSDVFLFKRKDMWELLPFTVGRPGWDNWMMWQATNIGCPVVDLLPSVTLAHSFHLSGPDQKIPIQQFWANDKLSQRNRALLTTGQQPCLRDVKEAGNLWELRSEGLVKM